VSTNFNIRSVPDKTAKITALLFLAVTAALWSLGGLLIKSVSAHPLAIAGVRSLLAALVMRIVLGKPKITGSKEQIAAALAYTGTVIFFVSATKYTTAANAILLQYTAPIYVAILSAWLLKERTSSFDWLTIIVVLAGMSLFFIDHLSAKGLFGSILAIASGLTFAFLNIFMRMQKDESPWESVFLGNLLTAVIGIPFLFLSWPNTSGWFYLFLLGTLQLGAPYILYAKAIKQATALEAVLILVLEPILNPIWVYFFLGETPGLWALVGGTIVVAAITLRSILSIISTQAKI